MACPDEATLLALVGGKLDGIVARHVRRHIDSCDSCQLASAEAAQTLPSASTPAAASTMAPGDIVDARFVLERMVGQGGVGVVWAARRRDDGSAVAIKVLREASDECTRRLVREARLANQLQHPALVRIHEVLAASNVGPAMIMELLEGCDLSAHLELRSRFDVQHASEILWPIADALVALHAQQVAHRDLKPANVFLEHAEGRPRVRILDLGMARALDLENVTANASRLTSPQAVFGTPRYMAPEQFEGARDVDGHADLWALGAMAYRMLGGRPHVQGWRYHDVLRELHTQPIADLAGLTTDLPDVLASLVRRSLALRPAERPDARAWRDALASLGGSPHHQRAP